MFRVKLLRRYRSRTRVGVYIDGYNLYYGMRQLFGRSTSGWRWLNVEALALQLVKRYFENALLDSVTYCTALRERDSDESSIADQQTYLGALEQLEKVRLLYGNYTTTTSRGVLLSTVRNKSNQFTKQVIPQSHEIPAWLFHSKVINQRGETNLLMHFESFIEKRTDVNLASALLRDTYQRRIDAAVVITNDGDLQLALDYARQEIPIVLVNPQPKKLARILVGEQSAGVGGHAWVNLDTALVNACQFSKNFEGYEKPFGW